MNDLVSDWVKRRFAVPAPVAGPVVDQPVQSPPAPELSQPDETKPATPQNLDNGSPFAVPPPTISDRVSGGLAALADAASRAGKSNSNYFQTVIQHQEAQRDNALKRQQLGIEAARQIALQKYQGGELANRQAQTAREQAALDETARHNRENEKILSQNAGTRANNAGLKLGQQSDQRRADRLTKMGEALDPSKSSRTPLGLSKQVFDRAERLETLASAFSDGNLDSRQIEELAIGLNAMLSGSNTGAQHQVESLVPKSVWGNTQKLTEFLTNAPRGTGQQEFVKRMLGSIGREKLTAADQIKRTQFQRLSQFQDLEKDAPDEFKNTLQSFGVDPAEYQSWKKGGFKPMSAVQGAETPGGGKIRVSNGKEIVMIDPADEADAAKDGFRRVQ